MSDALFEYLDFADHKTAARGKAYYEKGQVLGLLGDGKLFSAKVRGSTEYIVTLAYEDEWSGECTCPVEVDCKHCIAAACALIDECVITGALKPRKIPPKKQRTSKAPPRASSFAEQVAERLGRTPGSVEAALIKDVESLYLRNGGDAVIATNTLRNIVPSAKHEWQWKMHKVWDERPSSAWETLLYLIQFMTERGDRLPPLFKQVVAPEEVAGFISTAERRRAIAEWQARLAKLDGSWDQHSADRQVELRVLFELKSARLLSRTREDQPFEPVGKRAYQQMDAENLRGALRLEEASLALWHAFRRCQPIDGAIRYIARKEIGSLLLRDPHLAPLIWSSAGEPFKRASEQLQWKVVESEDGKGDDEFHLILPDGTAPPPAVLAIDGRPSLYVTSDTIFEAPPLAGLEACEPIKIPAAALDSTAGLALRERLGVPLPRRLQGRVSQTRARVQITCELSRHTYAPGEQIRIRARANFAGAAPDLILTGGGWSSRAHSRPQAGEIVQIDRSALPLAALAIQQFDLSWNGYGEYWDRKIGKQFPMEFAEWLKKLPEEVELLLGEELASFKEAPLQASFQLDIQESGIDWFDVRLQLKVADTTLTDEEIAALLKARGGYVRLGAKGWRRLAFELTEDDETSLADLGLNAREVAAEPQRLHALQLAGKGAAQLMPSKQAALLKRRSSEIQARVTPEIPAAITAELRPYQVEGFHFLAYLTANRFGGILADDMGLGKTVQTLTWLAWLREQEPRMPSLVVCPKSVMDNWAAEAERFLPGLRVRICRGSEAGECAGARDAADLFVINYAQLRLFEEAMIAAPWQAVILDEAQAIKNPDSRTTQAALRLQAVHRVALSGTPIENRLLDLWSIMGFAMPGVLGLRGRFTKSFDSKSDVFARRRLAARVRPFVLRRTKGEVARDLPDRIEEDLHCEMEGDQAKLYSAELKRARQQLLKLKTARELDKHRFHILTSLLRLRQICCHPALIDSSAATAGSAKLGALLDLLEPLMEEGHKVLVFSQFIGMLELIEKEVEARGWRRFLLTGGTEDRGALVRDFQSAEGAAVFLISLKAGGAGLNLTAASYVVLFDPWWNPAVENQAIDRTHRIGQVNKVIAYRLLVKETIEEKIRSLQKHKGALAADILGEETFARALTIEDFKFLLGEESAG